MRLKTVIKLGTIVSVALFCMAVGYFAFMQLDTAGRNREVNLFSLIPQSAVSVLESSNINTFFNELPQLNYSHEIERLQSPGLFSFLLNGLNHYATVNAHGLSSQMSRMAVSFHTPFTPRDQVVYLGMGKTDEKMLETILQEYAPSNFLPKEESYRGKSIVIYPLGTEEYLACYSGMGFQVISLQKRLIEQVVDAEIDECSLNEDPVFSSILQQKKSYSALALYSRSAGVPFLKLGPDCWSEYEFHANSDVLYLTGEIYMPDTCNCLIPQQAIHEKTTVYEPESIFFTAEKDSVVHYIEKVCDEEVAADRTLFDQCMANLSKEAVCTLVADMQKVPDNIDMFRYSLPDFLLENAPLFRSFIFSAQYSWNADSRLSHIWVFTYKD